MQFVTTEERKIKNEKENIWQNWKVRAMSKSGDPLRITYHYCAYYPGFEKNFNTLMYLIQL